MKVLHLIDPSGAGGGPCTMRLAAEAISAVDQAIHDVLVLGTGVHVERARQCGLDPIGSVSLRGRVAPTVGRIIECYERTTVPYGAVHAWTARAAGIALDTESGVETDQQSRRHIVSICGETVSAELLSPFAEAPVHVVTPFQSIRKRCEALGVGTERMSIIRPAIDPTVLDMPREQIRARWNADADTFIVGLLAEPASDADAHAAMTVAARLALSGKHARIVVHPAAHRRLEAEEALRHIGMSGLLILDEDLALPWRIARGLDAAIALSHRHDDAQQSRESSMPLLWASAGGAAVPAGADVNAICAAIGALCDRASVRKQEGKPADIAAGALTRRQFAESLAALYGAPVTAVRKRSSAAKMAASNV